MNVKCPHCGNDGEGVNNKCPRCGFKLDSCVSKQFNRNIYVTVMIIICAVMACLTYRHWNNDSSSKVESVAIAKTAAADNTKNSSKNIVVYKAKELDESNKNLEATQACIRLFQEMSNMTNENIVLAKRRHGLDMQYVDVMRNCTRNNNSPESVCHESTQDVRDQIKELDIENALLSKKEFKNEEERRINHCEQYQLK